MAEVAAKVAIDAAEGYGATDVEGDVRVGLDGQAEIRIRMKLPKPDEPGANDPS